MTDPLAAFESATIDAAAAETDLDPGDIRGLIRRQQRLVREFPDMTVEALVHDWRKTFPEDPLVGTDTTGYYLSVRPHVWSDIVSRLNPTADEREALTLANAKQFERWRGEPADGTAIVLTK